MRGLQAAKAADYRKTLTGNRCGAFVRLASDPQGLL
jgi:hypothetical protein